MIALCKGRDCVMRENCYRYKLRPSRDFTMEDYDINKRDDGICEKYFPIIVV